MARFREEDGGEGLDGTGAGDGEGDGLAGRFAGEVLADGVDPGDGLTFEFEQQVAEQDGLLVGGAFDEADDEQGVVAVAAGELLFDGGWQFDLLQTDAEDGLGFRKILEPCADDVAGDGDREIAAEDHSVDAYDLSIGVEQGSAGVAGGEAHVRFDVGDAHLGLDLACAHRTDDTRRDRPALSPGVPDGEDPFADAQAGGVAGGQRR
nr:hypothetical protein [Dictyobacter aurantiacus]